MTTAVGRSYAPITYAVGREKVREYASATGETNPLHFDLDAARAAGYDDLVAPPMFAVVYSSPALTAAMLDPDLGVDFTRVVHGGQELVWGPLVIAGDEVTSTATVTDVSERSGMTFYVFEVTSKNGGAETVCTGRWTIIVRGAS
jgi:acyl dehydratase